MGHHVIAIVVRLVVMGAALGAYYAAIPFLFPDDGGGANIGAGLIAFGAVVLVSFGWACVDGRRRGASPTVVTWAVVAAVFGVLWLLGLALVEGDDSLGVAERLVLDSSVVVFTAGLAFLPAGLGAALGGTAHRPKLIHAISEQRVLLQLQQLRLRSSPPPYPVSVPLAPMTRWHGTTIGIGLRPLARPTARKAARRRAGRRSRVGGGLAVGDLLERSHTRRWNSVPTGARGRSKSGSPRAKYAVSCRTASTSTGRLGSGAEGAPVDRPLERRELDRDDRAAR